MRNYKHKEAFCLMNYICEDCKHHEVIWNSRDGVTPFGTSCPSCGSGSLMHVYFRSDIHVSDHKLNKFQKYWRDGTDKEARAILHHRYNNKAFQEYFEDYKNEEDFIIEVLKDNHEFQKGWPILDIYLGDV